MNVTFRKRYMLEYYAALVFIHVCRVRNVHGASSSKFLSKNYQTYVAPDNTKWIQVSQLDPILLSIEEKLTDLSDKQKQDTETSHISNDVQIISHRLQNVEDQIARAESFNKMRLEKLLESTMRGEFLIDQLNRRIEKNQQQINNRLTEIDTALDKISKAQESLEKGVRKVSTMQSILSNAIDELLQNTSEIRKEATDTVHFLNSTHKQMEAQLAKMVENVTACCRDTILPTADYSNSSAADKLLKYGNESDMTRMSVLSRDEIINDIQKQLQDESSKLIATIDDKYNELRDQAQLIESSVKECVSVGNKIHSRMDTEQQETNDYLDNFLETLVHELKTHNENGLSQLEANLRTNFDSVLNEQHVFMNNCRRLQLNEQQMEEKLVTILQKLFNYIDNRTDSMRLNLENLINYEERQGISQAETLEELTKNIQQKNNQFDELSGFSVSKITEMEKNFTLLQTNVIHLLSSLVSVDINVQEVKRHLKIATPSSDGNLTKSATSTKPNETKDKMTTTTTKRTTGEPATVSRNISYSPSTPPHYKSPSKANRTGAMSSGTKPKRGTTSTQESASASENRGTAEKLCEDRDFC